jgi:Domain of unknown function (DUF4279)
MEWPERFSERVHIIAHGEAFDVDAFLAESTLRPDFVWRRKSPLTSGVEFFLGDGRSISLPDQEQMAITYLKEHSDELRAVARFPGGDAFILGLVYIAKLEGSDGVALDWPRALMLPAIEVGITPIHYITYERLPRPEDERKPFAYFYLTGMFDPDEITAHAGVAPSETARVGDSIGESGRKRLASLWGLRSRLQPSDRVDLHVEDVLNQLDANGPAFQKLSRELEGVIEIGGLPQDYLPAVCLEPEIVGRLAEYNLRLDIDR